jgi:hypothetical protein
VPDGFEFIPVHPDGSPAPELIWGSRFK